jgi:hypothetical protein
MFSLGCLECETLVGYGKHTLGNWTAEMQNNKNAVQFFPGRWARVPALKFD